MDALNTSVSTDDVTPKSVHGYITRAYAQLFGFEIACDCDDTSIVAKIAIS